MTLFELADVMARGGTLALLMLWIWLLLRDHRDTPAACIAGAMNLSIAAHVLATIPDDPFPPALNIAFDSVSVTASAWFYLFSRAWFGDERRIPLAAWLGVPWLFGIVDTGRSRSRLADVPDFPQRDGSRRVRAASALVALDPVHQLDQHHH